MVGISRRMLQRYIAMLLVCQTWEELMTRLRHRWRRPRFALTTLAKIVRGASDALRIFAWRTQDLGRKEKPDK